MTLNVYYKTRLGRIYLNDSLEVMKTMKADSVNLIMTSPPFGLTREKEYGNAREQACLDWFKPFARTFHRILKDSGSLVIDIGGAWKPGYPVRSLYHWKLLIMLCEEFGFHLAQDFYWWNPSKLPTPAKWVNIRRIRVKDGINTVWWLSKTEWPRASNRRVLQTYSPSRKRFLPMATRRRSGHPATTSARNSASIMARPSQPNLLAIPNTESNSAYMRYCQKHKIKAHPARFPADLPEYFIRMLTDPGDKVVDPFAGSCVTGEIAERLGRKWVCVEMVKDYLEGALGRFIERPMLNRSTPKDEDAYYRIPRPGLLWNGPDPIPLVEDGGRQRPPGMNAKPRKPSSMRKSKAENTEPESCPDVAESEKGNITTDRE